MNTEEIQKALDDKFKDLQEQLKDAQENGASKEEVQKLHDAIKTQGEALEDFMEAQRKKVVESLEKQFADFAEENKEEISKIYKQGHGTLEFVPKAVGALTTGSGTDAETPPVNRGTNLGNFNLRNDNAMMSLMTVTSTDRDSLSYTELVPKEGNYAFVAEGTAKPQIDFSWSNRYPEPKKIAAYEVLTEEAATDVKRLVSVGKEYLRKKHDLFKVDACFFADGTGNNPTGATVYGRTFVAGDMALAVTNPNFMDVVNAAVTDVFITQNYTDEAHYQPNVALISPVDFFLNLVSAKDANGLPLYPQAGLFNQVSLGGVTIKPWIKIPSGKLFVADMKVYNVVNYIPFSIRIGWINDQFITNQFTMLGESRFYQYVKNLDQNALIYDDIATIKTAITAA